MKTTLIQLRRKKYHQFPEADQPLDIDALKLFVDFLAGCFLILEMAFLQRNIAAAVSLVTHVVSNFKIFGRASEALEEIKKLNKAETKELSNIFATALDLKNDKLEAQFEKFFDFLSRGYYILSQAILDGNIAFNFAVGIFQTRDFKQLIPNVSYSLLPDAGDDRNIFTVGFDWQENNDVPVLVANTVDTVTEIIDFGREFVLYIISLRREEEPIPDPKAQAQLQEAVAATD